MAKQNDTAPAEATIPEDEPKVIEYRRILITQVRYGAVDAQAELRRFIFGREHTALRVPRGIEPELVSECITEWLKPDMPPGVYKNTLEVLRFYERADVVGHLMGALRNSEADTESMRRSLLIVQTAADLGTDEQIQQTADYFLRVLMPHRIMRNTFPEMLLTALVLAPMDTLDAARKRLDVEIDRAALTQLDSEAAMADYDRLAAIRANDLPRLEPAVRTKTEIASREQDARRGDLVTMYASQDIPGGDVMRVWAGRLLRREAMEGNPEPVRAEFAARLSQATEDTIDDAAVRHPFVRVAQAILYLQGRLPLKARNLYDSVAEKGQHFLWDDLPA